MTARRGSTVAGVEPEGHVARDDRAMNLEELRALEREHVVPAYARMPVAFVRGEGARLWDADGQRLVLNATGPATVRFLPPLTIGEAEVDEALARLRALL
jgi:acetylornithine/succinyldiaminopimelate/putrescine aminotransferase